MCSVPPSASSCFSEMLDGVKALVCVSVVSEGFCVNIVLEYFFQGGDFQGGDVLFFYPFAC